MAEMERHIRRIPGGAIDYVHYDRLARRLRGRGTRRSMAAQRKALLAALGAMRKAAWQLVTIPTAAISRTGRQVVQFWMISPLGIADQIRAHGHRANRRHLL